MEQCEEQFALHTVIRKVGSVSLTYKLFVWDGHYDLTVFSNELKNDKVYVHDITQSKDTALSLLCLLSDNTVFPYNVPEILDDLIGNYL